MKNKCTYCAGTGYVDIEKELSQADIQTYEWGYQQPKWDRQPTAELDKCPLCNGSGEIEE